MGTWGDRSETGSKPPLLARFGSSYLFRRVVAALAIAGVFALIGMASDAFGAYVEECPATDTVNDGAVRQSCLAVTERVEAGVDRLVDAVTLIGWSVGVLLVLSIVVVIARMFRAGS